MNAPLTYDKAMDSPDSQKWVSAMDDEIKSLQLNDTCTLTEQPTNKSVVGGKWIFKIKGNPETPIYKARYVAKDTRKFTVSITPKLFLRQLVWNPSEPSCRLQFRTT